MAAFCVSFSPQALSRPTNTRSPRTPPRRKPLKSPNPKVKPPKPLHRSSSSLIGIEATTYTRLPPRDDAALSSIDPLFQEIKLSDSHVALSETNADKFDGLESEGEGADDGLGFDVDRFEVSYGELDSDEEEDDEFEAEGEGVTQFMGLGGDDFQFKGRPSGAKVWSKGRGWIADGLGQGLVENRGGAVVVGDMEKRGGVGCGWQWVWRGQGRGRMGAGAARLVVRAEV